MNKEQIWSCLKQSDATYSSIHYEATRDINHYEYLSGPLKEIRYMCEQTKNLFKSLGVDAYAFYMELDWGRMVWASVDKNGLTVDLEAENPQQYGWSDLPFRVLLSINKPIKYIALGKTHKEIPVTEWKMLRNPSLDSYIKR